MEEKKKNQEDRFTCDVYVNLYPKGTKIRKNKDGTVTLIPPKGCNKSSDEKNK